MSREESYQIRYTIALIAEFAKIFHLGQRQAYKLLEEVQRSELFEENGMEVFS